MTERIEANRGIACMTSTSLKIFQYIADLDCFVVSEQYRSIADELGLTEWNPVVWIGCLFSMDNDVGEHWFDNWDLRAQLRQYVEQQVDARIRQYHETPPERRQLAAVFGAIPYGTADLPREQQIAVGMDYYTGMREHQQQIVRAIAELERMNRQP
jgi:hypothetical protein